MNDNPNPTPDPRRLLGGYATGNLSEAEAQELLRASLHDQELFDALADEQALRDLLENPGVKRELIEALRPSRWERFRKWMATPVGWGAAGVAVATAALTLVIAPQAMRKAAEPVPSRVEQAAVAAPQEKERAKASEPLIPPQRRRAPEPRKPAVERKEERAVPATTPPPPAPPQQAPLQAQQRLAGEADQQRVEPQRQVATRIRDAAPKAEAQAEQEAQAPAAPPALSSSSKTAESVEVSAAAPLLDTAQPVYVLEARDANGTFVAVRRPAPGRVRLRVHPAEDGFAVLQLNREPPLRLAVRKGVPALLPADGLDVNTGDRLQLTFAYGQNLPGTTGGPAGFRAGAKAKQAAPPAPILIRIGAGTER